MSSILEELWYDKVIYRETTKEAKELIGCIADHHDNLRATLTDVQKETLERLDDCYAELADITSVKFLCMRFAWEQKSPSRLWVNK